MASIGLGKRGVGVVESNTISMTIGAAASLPLRCCGAPLAYNPAPSYTISLLFLALFATVIGFGAFLTLAPHRRCARRLFVGAVPDPGARPERLVRGLPATSPRRSSASP